MPRYFIEEETLLEWQEFETAEMEDENGSLPEGYEPVNLNRYNRAPNGQLTVYEPGSARFEPEELKGEEARVYALLRERGANEVVVRYDGGHDEGFAHFEEAVTFDARFSRDDLARMLCDGPLGDAPITPYIWYPDGKEISRERRAQDALDGYANALATCLLGRGFGTGEFELLGRFRANLVTGEVQDEDIPGAVPNTSFDEEE